MYRQCNDREFIGGKMILNHLGIQLQADWD
jgi:hypothetical protein